MAKRLSARIAERTGRKTPSRSGKNRAAFLAVRDDVKEAIDDGWPVKEIWETLYEEGKVSFSYEAFRTYVNRLILEKRLETERGRVAGKEEGGRQVRSGGRSPRRQEFYGRAPQFYV
jgi:hypothetical protein